VLSNAAGTHFASHGNELQQALSNVMHSKFFNEGRSL